MPEMTLEKTEMKGYPIRYWAERYGLSERYLYNAVAAGRLHCLRFGRAIRVSPAQFARFIESVEA